MSPDEKTPKGFHQPSIERLAPPPLEERELKISSPIEARNSSGFSESLGPVTLGDYASRTNNKTPVIAPRASTNTLSQSSAAGTPTISRRPSPPMAPAPSIRSPSVRSPSIRSPTSPISRAPTSPLPAPPLEMFNNGPGLNGSSTRKPAGLQIQWPPMDDVIRHATPPIKHKRTVSRHTPAPTPNPGKPDNTRLDPNDLDDLFDVLDTVNHKRIDSQRAAAPRTARRRAESPEARGRGPSRQGSRDQFAVNQRGRQQGREKAHQRSPSSPLPMSPQARLYREDVDEPDLHEDDYEDERYYTTGQGAHHARRDASESRSRTRGRADGRRREPTYMRSPSSPPIMSPQARLYRDEADDEFEDERYYMPVPRTRNDSRGRGRSASRNNGASALRSPSSPLPMSPGAQLYAQMADEAEAEERLTRRTIRRTLREESRNRHGLRRSRSERTLRQWSDQLERVGHMSRRPSISGFLPMSAVPARAISTSRGAGLPATPRAWKNELGGSNPGSRAGSPAPGPRGRSPAVPTTRTPRMASPGRNMSPSIRALESARGISPDPRTRTPGSLRTGSPAPPPLSGGSNHSRGRSDSSLKASQPTPPPSLGLPAQPGVLRMQNYYPGSGKPIADYEQVPSPRSYGSEIPSLPSLHSRNGSGANTTEFKPLIRHLRPQPPPDSPPPLPKDLPVHPALQMHLDPGKKDPTFSPSSRGRRRIDDQSNNEQSIVVGIGIDDPAISWDAKPEMQQLRSNTHRSPSKSPGMTRSTSSMEAIGSSNQI